MKKPADLRAALHKLQGHPISGLYYRVLRPKYMHSPLSTEGARRTGARYNPKDRFGALYLAEDPEIGLSEAKLTLQGLPEFTRIKPATRVILCVEVKLSSVLDLTQEATMKALGTTLQELCGPWEVYDYQGKIAPTQQLGSAALFVGHLQGIQYPSAKDPLRHNLAIFPERLGKGGWVEVADPDGVFKGRIP